LINLYGIDAVSRKEWGAKPPAKKRTPVSRYDYLEVHHGVSGNDTARLDPVGVLRAYQKGHLDRGWSDLFYCSGIDKKGVLYDGRSEFRSHSGVWGEAFTVVLLGNNDTEEVTPEQAATIKKLWAGMKAENSAPTTRLAYHRERATLEKKYQSLCPGKFGIATVNNIRSGRDKDVSGNMDKEDVIEWQEILIEAGYDLGSFGPNEDGVDGEWGNLTDVAHDEFTAEAKNLRAWAQTLLDLKEVDTIDRLTAVRLDNAKLVSKLTAQVDKLEAEALSTEDTMGMVRDLQSVINEVVAWRG
jgi:hypothetical protein